MSHRIPPRLLLVENDPDTAGSITETLRDHFGTGCVCQAGTVAEAVAVDSQEIDMALCSMDLPDGTGLDLLNYFLHHRPDLPVVLLTSQGILENAMTAIRRGAYDYIVKSGGYLLTIPLIVEKNLAIWRTKQENHQLQEQLTRTLDEVRVKNSQLEDAVMQLKVAAATDPLTGLNNRRSFNQAMDRSYAEATRYNQDLACVLIDIDHFKLINDTLGHQAGDDLLQITAEILNSQCRRSDVVGRLGGDEFVLMMPQTDEQTARQVAERISEEFDESIRDAFHDSSVVEKISLSMGVATVRQSKPTDPQQLIAFADRALYRAKQTGKAKLVTYGQGVTVPASEPASPL